MTAPTDFARRRAQYLVAAGNYLAALDPLRDVLTADPNDSEAHHMLSQSLRSLGRLTGASYEASQAIAIAPYVATYHVEFALTLMLQQKPKAALAEIDEALALDPDYGSAYLVKARLLRVAGKKVQAAASLDKALELLPNSPQVLAEAGYAALESGRIAEVEASARAVLSIDPGSCDGLVLMGHARLAAGATDEALDLALSALAQDPGDQDALSLLAATKIKANLLGGLWWKWNRLLVKLGASRAIFLIVGIWVVYRWLTLASENLGLPDATRTVLTLLYLGFALYTISADVIVQRMISKETERVRLRAGF